MIDLLWGLTIFWLMLFHLGADMGVAGPQLYPAVRHHLAAGEPITALRALGQLVCSLGYQGVPVFMILSGLSLALRSYRHRRGAPVASY
jgi:peptidoglycan/LPS O-acetylase OafA/YrhL